MSLVSRHSAATLHLFLRAIHNYEPALGKFIHGFVVVVYTLFELPDGTEVRLVNGYIKFSVVDCYYRDGTEEARELSFLNFVVPDSFVPNIPLMGPDDPDNEEEDEDTALEQWLLALEARREGDCFYRSNGLESPTGCHYHYEGTTTHNGSPVFDCLCEHSGRTLFQALQQASWPTS